MSLQPGARLGSYEVVAAIGAGGMGEVYRATDTSLKRDVAIKVLPDAVAAMPERLARFQREAQVLAALNHPNIAQIYGVEKAVGGSAALVMELVEGPTLADLIASMPLSGRKGLPYSDALAIANQIALGLESAHEQGIVHRDLKPANVKVREDGTVKVLDFGLAKALGPDGQASRGAVSQSMSPTITTPAMTEMGMILGTAAYMSPEQARGRPVDKRCDIWAFGIVLYEMLTGRRAFDGEDVSVTLSQVLQREPDLGALPSDLPARVTQVLRVCLRKDPKQRVGDIRDVRLALEGAFETAAPEAVGAIAAVRPLWRRALPAATAVLLTSLAAGAVAWHFWPAAGASLVTRFSYVVPSDHQFRRTGRSVIALSRDGRSVVYNTSGGLYLVTLDGEGAKLVPRSESDMSNPFLSPDGRTVGYWDAGAQQLKRIELAGGGAPAVIADAGNPLGVSWERDDSILYGQVQGILRVAASGGTPQLVIEAREGERLHGPQLLPDQASVLYTVTTGAWEEARIVVESLSTHERTVLVDGGTDGQYVEPGYLVYSFSGGLFARSFDADRLTVGGNAVQLIEHLTRATPGSGAANYAVSSDGTLAYLSDGSLGRRTVVWVDRQGRAEPLGLEARGYVYPRLSRDRTRVALSGDGDVLAWDLGARRLTNVTASEDLDQYAIWAPDDRRLIFSNTRGGLARLYWQAADGEGAAEPLTSGSDATVLHFPHSVTSDGQLIYREERRPGTDLRIVSLSGDHATRDLLSTEFIEINAELSPNGRWLAYQSDLSGANEVYVSPFPDVASRRWTLSSGGGTRPAWSLDGRELFYVNRARQLMAVDVEPDHSSFIYGNGRPLFDVSRYFMGAAGRSYAVDAERFLFIDTANQPVGDPALARRIHVALNWTEELRRRVPVD